MSVRSEGEVIMSDGSPIEWTYVAWSTIRGCTKVSRECTGYAEALAERGRDISAHPSEQGSGLRLVTEKPLEPPQGNRSRTVFDNAMSDLFHEEVPGQFISEVLVGPRRGVSTSTASTKGKRPHRRQHPAFRAELGAPAEAEIITSSAQAWPQIDRLTARIGLQGRYAS